MLELQEMQSYHSFFQFFYFLPINFSFLLEMLYIFFTTDHLNLMIQNIVIDFNKDSCSFKLKYNYYLLNVMLD